MQLVAYFLLFLALARLAVSISWPISGGQTPDLPQSSPFGPRLKVSEDNRTDYHPGIDIPTPLNTPLRAIMAGTVTLAGSVPQYTDPVLQVRHTLGDGTIIYANYLHVNTTTPVIAGDMVSEGQVIAYSGASVSGFAHLHFEIRRDNSSQSRVENPWGYLPFNDTVRHIVYIASHSRTGQTLNNVSVIVSFPPDELDWVLLELEFSSASSTNVYPMNLNTIAHSSPLNSGLDSLVFNIDSISAQVYPYPFTSASLSRNQWATYQIDFFNLNLDLSTVQGITVRAYDTADQDTSSSYDASLRLVSGTSPTSIPPTVPPPSNTNSATASPSSGQSSAPSSSPSPTSAASSRFGSLLSLLVLVILPIV